MRLGNRLARYWASNLGPREHINQARNWAYDQVRDWAFNRALEWLVDQARQFPSEPSYNGPLTGP